MAILIDPPAWPAHGTLWSHLVSDSDYDELHAFAKKLGIPRRSFDLDHYDVPGSLYERAIALGALAVTAKNVVHALRGSGLRVRQIEREAAMPVRRRQYLLSEWSALGAFLGFGGGAGSSLNIEAWRRVGSELIARWNEPHRQYHDERHLEDVLLALDHLSVRGEMLAPSTLLAAWFHDAVYTGATGGAGNAGGVGADEMDSARLAASALGGLDLDAGLVQRVGDLIVATTPAGTSGSGVAAGGSIASDAAALLDADLSIFASPLHRYEQYAASVRVEYAHVPEVDFASARARILSAYLEQPTIYRTPTAHELWETRARTNLAREIERLGR